MRAAVLNAIGTPLAIEDLTIAEPGTGEALVRVVAAGVCHSDLHFIEGTYKRDLPMVLGHEVAGIVEAVGPGVTNVVRGDRVIIGFVQPCGYCNYCQSGHPNLCVTPTTTRTPEQPSLKRGETAVTPMAQIGGFADYSLTPAAGLVKVPDGVGLDIAALVGCSVTTGYGAVTNTAQVEPGSTVAVIGTGGVGLNIIHTARLVGARRIIAIDLVDYKLDLAKEFGATDGVNASGGDAVQQVLNLTDGGVDYAFEAIGLKQTARQAYDMLRRGGTAVVVGMVPPEDVIEVPGLIWRDEKVLRGSFYGSARFHVDMPRILDLYQQGKLELDRLVTRRFPLDQINEAFDVLKQGGVARSVLDINPE